MKITTNRHWREFIHPADVPEKILLENFDYACTRHCPECQHEDDDVTSATCPDCGERMYLDSLSLFLQYRGNYLCDADFMATDTDLLCRGWHGIYPVGYTMALLLRISDDGERYQIATLTE